jgi:cholesterol oxidase
MTVEHFDAVIVGSGFGGSVMAYRLADAGLTVCVLERGKPFPPNSFPRSPYRTQRNFWDPSAGLYGMFNLWSFQGIDALVSSGLGGGSLIYANVLIRKDERWFVQEDLANGGFEYWPITRDDLEPHYDRVEKMLDAQTFPLAHEPYAQVPKTRAFKEAAAKLGLDWFLPNLAVTFANPGEDPVPGEPIKDEHPNLHGRTRYTCRLCGECDVGCNYGSKNTLDYNYLSAAQRLGADIRTLSEVRAFEPRAGGGYTLRYVAHSLANAGRVFDTHAPGALEQHTLTADRLVLGAGTLGSTYLLLKQRARGALPGISDALGNRFCGNGDLLTFAVRSSEQIDGRRVARLIDGGYGPVITSAIRVPDTLDGGDGRGFYIEDAGYPEFANWMLQLVESPFSLWGLRAVAHRLLGQLLRGRRETDLGAEVSAALGTSELSAGLLPLLGMGRDIPDGRMFLNADGRLEARWHKQKSGPYFERVRQTMKSISGALGAKFVETPLQHLSRVITVHPLGGCAMGRHPGEGVVDASGEVFGFPDLYVADGAVMPGPVGANPCLTIAALADRFADGILTRPRVGSPAPSS